MTTQTENKLRVRKAAGWILQGHSVSHVVARLAEYEGVSRRTARRIAGKVMDLVHRDLEATNVENPQMSTVLIHNLQECMARGMESNNIGAAVAAARELSAMLGIGVHNRRAPLTTNTGAEGVAFSKVVELRLTIGLKASPLGQEAPLHSVRKDDRTL